MKSKMEFNKDSINKDKLQYWCRMCDRELGRKHSRSPQSKMMQKAYNQSEKGKESQKRYSLSEKGKKADSRYDIKYDFGITLEQKNEMIMKQNNVCFICKRQPSNRNKYDTILHIDHDHKTDKIRGLLCFKCNLLLGFAEDSTTILQNAITYLKQHS